MYIKPEHQNSADDLSKTKTQMRPALSCFDTFYVR